MHVYEVRPRSDKRGVDLISDALPFGRLWYGEPNPVSNAVGYVKFFSKAKARTSEQARKAAMTRWEKFKRRKKYGRNKTRPAH
jgi:hypothetical protein